MSELTPKVGKPKLSLKYVNVFGIPSLIRILRAPRFKKPYTTAAHPPWSKHRYHMAGLSEPMRKAIGNFAKVADATGGLALSDRMSIISQVLKGKSYGGTKRPAPIPKLSYEQYRAKVEEVKRLVEG